MSSSAARSRANASSGSRPGPAYNPAPSPTMPAHERCSSSHPRGLHSGLPADFLQLRAAAERGQDKGSVGEGLEMRVEEGMRFLAPQGEKLVDQRDRLLAPSGLFGRPCTKGETGINELGVLHRPGELQRVLCS